MPAAVVPSCPLRMPGGIGVVCLAACEPHPHLPNCLFSKTRRFYCSNSSAANLCVCLLAVSVHTSMGQRPSLPLRLKGTPGPLQQCSPSRCPQKQSFIPVSYPFGPSHAHKMRPDALLLAQCGGWWLAKPSRRRGVTDYLMSFVDRCLLGSGFCFGFFFSR